MRSYRRKRPPLDACPVELVLSMVQGKWTARLIFLLLQRPCHFGELQRLIPGISVEVLATRLHTLQGVGLATVQSRTGPNNVTLSIYALTEKGQSLAPVLQGLADWGQRELRTQGLSWEPPLIDRDAVEPVP
jgi:DNA-binding HxlR family transcriptional regulator